MAGFYLHIPFCRKACRYCDFHFSVSLNQKPEIIKAIGKEMLLRLEYTGEEEIGTIFFGGGTPSVLEESELKYLMDIIYRNNIKDDAEISFEANPDDLTEDYLKMLYSSGINRLSIGVQSFFEDDLALMRRSHSMKQAFHSIENALMTGFSNISLDLIYGIPGSDTKRWERNLEIAIGFGIPHISAYHLTYEPGTVFNHWINKGRIFPVSEEESVSQFKLMRNKLVETGNYDHYEISNFAREGYYSLHNVNYWKQVSYAGFGPSAHSYNGKSRRWNISSNRRYYDNLMQGILYYEEEELSGDDLYNEYIMTSLRTKWGINSELLAEFGKERLGHFTKSVRKFIDDKLVKKNNQGYVLSEEGILMADYVIRELFV